MEEQMLCDQATLFDESDDRLMAAAEAVLFAMGDSVEISALADALQVRETRMRAVLEKMRIKYEAPSSGLMLQQFDTAVQLSTRPEQYENLTRLVRAPKKTALSGAALETLSIIAYRQPVTRAEIEDIRGVSCDYAINRLLDYDLIREEGRKDAPGRPILFGTTEQFLRSFGMKSLDELPPVDDARLEEFRREAETEIDERLGV